jgi:hypothetical protein
MLGGGMISSMWTKDYKFFLVESVPLRMGLTIRLASGDIVDRFVMEAWAGRFGAGLHVCPGVDVGIGAYGYRLQFLSPDAGEQ